jgi:hypothetical protein
MKVKKFTQLELENFGMGVADAEEAEGRETFSVADVRAGEMLFKKNLRDSGKIEAGEEIPSWADVYQQLMNANIRPRLAAYIAWATMPKKYRWPATQDELAQQVLGLTSDRAIATWRKKYPEIDMMISALQAEAMLEYRPGAFHALGTVASDPTYRANPDRRLFFEMSNDYTPRQKIEEGGSRVGHKVLGELKKKSTADLIELLGPDALVMMKELEEELEDQEEEQDTSTTPSATLPNGDDISEEDHD